MPAGIRQGFAAVQLTGAPHLPRGFHFMNIAWIGLGNMGTPMAANLVRAGHQVQGFDLSAPARDAAAELGVKSADSVTDAVRDADIVFTMLPAGRHVRSVLSGPDGVLANLQPGGLVVDSSTIDIQD